MGCRRERRDKQFVAREASATENRCSSVLQPPVQNGGSFVL